MSVSKNRSVGICRHHHLVAFLVSLVFSTNFAVSLPNTVSVVAPGLTTLSLQEAAEAEADARGNGSCRSCYSINRSDPLRHLKYYHGGYDVRNKHYWASAAFTGVHGYAVAGVWMLCGTGFGLFVITKKLRGNNRISAGPLTASSSRCPLVMFSVIVFFTFLAIVVSGVVLAANQSSQHRTDRLKKSILGAGREARHTIRKVIQTMTQMQNLLQPYDLRMAVELNITAHGLRKESRAIKQFIDQTDHSIGLAIQTSYIVHLVVVVINLLLLLAAIVLLLLHWQPWFITIIVLCWIITTMFWAITGFDFFFHNFAEDTCSAFRDYLQNPQNSSLSSILPCVDSAYANQVLVQIGSAVYNFIQALNLKIAELSKVLMKSKQSDSLAETFRVCQPFSGPPNYSYDRNCSEGEIPIGQVPQVLAALTCYKNESLTECARNGKFLSEGIYNITLAVSTSIEDLLEIYPDLRNLSECSFVKGRLSDIVSRQCRPFRSSLRMLWASMLSLSISMVVLVLLWVTKAYRDKGRSFSRCSIFPQSHARGNR
ncbi:uncharacterized protein LOC116198952 isoform X2 [Punica granatum]|uniref:Uncharacterized protein LOC116198952 isoform X2 n=1 Tax=Punica granatum TaxID=22663 RepID=A0A218VYQ4_PUNGR|nr:uncharacterized protein LOC116198952 isoform X2 [Punica granatum]OWM65684.1 hypothetical protein CDL15_Pgr017181 [Punica granatum]